MDALSAKSLLQMRGAVFGVDVGFSAKRRSTGLCLLTWDESSVDLHLRRTTADPVRRRTALQELLAWDSPPLTVALDGPLTNGLRRVRRYRVAEALLSHGVFQKRGKPGQTSSPVGLRLHEHATALAELILEEEAAGGCVLASARHREPIHPLAIVEAFPSQFLAALVDESGLPAIHRDASDRYWDCCLAAGHLKRLIDAWLPGRVVPDLCVFTNHDDRAAIVCALTALAVAHGDAVAVGDAEDGDIILPPRRFWGAGAGDVPWMEGALRRSLAFIQAEHDRGSAARLNEGQGRWLL